MDGMDQPCECTHRNPYALGHLQEGFHESTLQNLPEHVRQKMQGAFLLERLSQEELGPLGWLAPSSYGQVSGGTVTALTGESPDRIKGQATCMKLGRTSRGYHRARCTHRHHLPSSSNAARSLKRRGAEAVTGRYSAVAGRGRTLTALQSRAHVYCLQDRPPPAGLVSQQEAVVARRHSPMTAQMLQAPCGRNCGNSSVPS